MNDKILIVEDDPRVVRLITEILKAVGYETTAVSTGAQAIEQVAIEAPHLVLLDIMLPDDLNGFEVCRRLREFSEVPVIMLTARAQDSDIERGFDVGVDDYVTKPFNAKELVGRIRAVLRRSHRPEETVTSALACGDLQINFARHSVTVRGTPVELTRTEFALLRELALHANQVMLHEDLLAHVWGPEYRDDVDYLRAYVRFLRRKLEADPANPRYLLTHPGVGYLLACPPQDHSQA